MFSQLDDARREALLRKAAELVAEVRIEEEPKDSGAEGSAEKWLAEFALEHMPYNNEVGRLLAAARDVDSDWRSDLFIEGIYCTVFGDDDVLSGAWLRSGYETIRLLHGRQSPSCSLDPAHEALHIDVDRRNFVEFQDHDQPAFDKDSWLAEVHRQCGLEFAAYVEYWRETVYCELSRKE
jgi:hypothetical protein